MRITNVRAVQPIGPGSPPDWRTSLGQILVAVDTDRGLTGYGVGGGGAAGVHVVRTVLRDVVLGRSPEPVEYLWQSMYHATLPFGQKGLAIMAQSGVDLALWDLRGKAAGLPVVEILGGRGGASVPVYVTVWDGVTPEQASAHRAFKLHVEQPAGRDAADGVAAAVTQARRAVGDDALLMVDAWMRWDVETTLAVAERIAPFGIEWIEEPLPPDDLAGYARLAEECPLPIAGGEHEFTAAGFAPLIEGRLHQVLQPDVSWCGGLTELLKIYAAAQRAGLRVCPHRGAEIWALHAVAALDDQPLAESGRPWMTWIGGQPAISEGSIKVPEAPGLGVHFDEDALPGVTDPAAWQAK
ncbi:MAG: mandelate racemase/muconate lactonizing enzyme family protein [Planctomycetes bacterium]|nr:mandelate racemase/muconate lactonizing enzyme family protein [Planctomycetota bacterium]